MSFKKGKVKNEVGWSLGEFLDKDRALQQNGRDTSKEGVGCVWGMVGRLRDLKLASSPLNHESVVAQHLKPF